MSKDETKGPQSPSRKSSSPFTEAARLAAQAAKAAKRAEAEPSGLPQLFIVRAGEHAFTWELRRFGGVVLQRSGDAFPDAVSAREAGEGALQALLAARGTQAFKPD